jgi:hypothetical protein
MLPVCWSEKKNFLFCMFVWFPNKLTRYIFLFQRFSARDDDKVTACDNIKAKLSFFSLRNGVVLVQKVPTLKLVSRVLNRIPDRYMTSGVAQEKPTLANGETFDTLRDRAVVSFVGKGSETVTDDTVRRSLELTSVDLQFDGLENVLKEVSEKLVQGRLVFRNCIVFYLTFIFHKSKKRIESLFLQSVALQSW